MTAPRPAPRYEEIEGWLREQVLAGTPGEVLPSEAELAARFKVSRMTARQAVQNLAREGLVRRQRGSGTYIAPRPLHRNSGPLMSFSREMQRRGRRPSSRLLTAELRAALPSEVRALRLDPAARVVSLSRLRIADDIPVAIERVALPPECAPVLAADLEHGSLHEVLRELGREPTIALSWISARGAKAKEARLLDIASRSPMLVEHRVIFDRQDVPLEHSETAYVGERYVIDAVFTLADGDPAGRQHGDSQGSRLLVPAPTWPSAPDEHAAPE